MMVVEEGRIVYFSSLLGILICNLEFALEFMLWPLEVLANGLGRLIKGPWIHMGIFLGHGSKVTQLFISSPSSGLHSPIYRLARRQGQICSNMNL